MKEQEGTMIKGNRILKSAKPAVNEVNWLTEPAFITQNNKHKAINISLENNLLTAQMRRTLFEILPHFKTVNLASGDYLYQPGDYVDFLYFPETAVVSEFQILEDGKTVEIAMTGNEGVLGLLPVFDSYRATNWMQVSLGGKAFKIDSRIFEQKIVAHLPFQKMLLEYVNYYVHQISHRVVCNSHHLIEERFCTWLLMLQDRKKSDYLPLTQEQVARSLGVHRPSITHIAQILRTKQVIDYVRGNIYIRERRELEKLACPCFAETKDQLKKYH